MKKDTKGKPKLSLIPYEALVQTAKVFEFGATKYGKDSWRVDTDPEKIIDAALRHLHKLADGDLFDDESGLLHAAHVMSNMCMLIEDMKTWRGHR